jgi:hypothetical protein
VAGTGHRQTECSDSHAADTIRRLIVTRLSTEFVASFYFL